MITAVVSTLTTSCVIFTSGTLTTGALVSSAVIVFIGLILLCAGTLLLKKKSKYNA